MTAQDIISKAIGEIGTTEYPSGSNKVKYNTEYYGSAVSGKDYPWCCTFIWWLFHSLGQDKLFYNGKKTAYCPEVERYYKSIGQRYTSPKVGDLVLFDFSGKGIAGHIGIVEKVCDGSIYAIEGNTSVASDDNGGAVMRRYRTKSQIRGYARPKYEEGIMNFKDISGHYAEGAIRDLAAMGIVHGDGSGNFRPEYNIKRADVAIMIRNAIKYITGK